MAQSWRILRKVLVLNLHYCWFTFSLLCSFSVSAMVGYIVACGRKQYQCLPILFFPFLEEKKGRGGGGGGGS